MPYNYRSTMPDLYGGGGCPNTTDVLVPDLPFDFLQPTTRKQVTQAGYGGPFVIRSNPIGAIVDTIRGWCFPAPMEQTSSDGSSYAAPDGYGSYGEPSAPYPDTGGYTPGFAGLGGGNVGTVGGGMNCGSGTMWDASQQLCVPTPGSSMMPSSSMMPAASIDPCGVEALNTETKRFQTAAAAGDKRTICSVSVNADDCMRRASTPALKAAWASLKATSGSTAIAFGVTNCRTYLGTVPAAPATQGMGLTPSGMPMTTGTPTPVAGGSPGTDNSGMMGGMMGGGMRPDEIPMVVENPPMAAPMPGISNNPFAYINLADQLKAGVSALSANAAQNIVPTMYMPPMPATPNPMSLTEGNIFMRPSREPLGGSFDPGRISRSGGGQVMARGRNTMPVPSGRTTPSRRGYL